MKARPKLLPHLQLKNLAQVPVEAQTPPAPANVPLLNSDQNFKCSSGSKSSINKLLENNKPLIKRRAPHKQTLEKDTSIQRPNKLGLTVPISMILKNILMTPWELFRQV